MLRQLLETTKKRTFWSLKFSSQILQIKWERHTAEIGQTFNIFFAQPKMKSWCDKLELQHYICQYAGFHSLTDPTYRLRRKTSQHLVDPPSLDRVDLQAANSLSQFYATILQLDASLPYYRHKTHPSFSISFNPEEAKCRIFCVLSERFLVPRRYKVCLLKSKERRCWGKKAGGSSLLYKLVPYDSAWL